jgi:hypothetical protein
MPHGQQKGRRAGVAKGSSAKGGRRAAQKNVGGERVTRSSRAKVSCKS